MRGDPEAIVKANHMAQIAAIGDPHRQLELQAELQELVNSRRVRKSVGGTFSDLVRVNLEAQVGILL